MAKNHDICLEGSLYVVQSNGLNTNKNSYLGGTVEAVGAVTLDSTLSVAGATSFTVAPTGPVKTPTTNSATVGATVVLTAAQSGQVFINVSTSGSPSWTLPAAANGLTYTFICANTTAGFTVTAAGTIYAKTSATGTAISGTTLTNTQGTAVVGDTITLVSDGTGWRMTNQSGIFAAA
jgi:hypothetical protein